MELNRYREKNHKKIGIILFTFVCVFLIVGVILYQTYAIYEVVKDKDLLNGDIKDIGNIEFLVYVDDTLQKSIPEKDSGYSLDTSTSHCENGELVSWNNENWSVEVKNVTTTKTKCYLYFKEIYQEEILDGTIPNLGNGRLIPVTLSNTEKPSDVTEYSNSENQYGGKVFKADITSEWYKYEEQKWANAVILKDGIADNYAPGAEIPESAIESYFVWIPRYRYEIFNEGIYDSLDANVVNGRVENKSQIINIQFENKNKGISTGSTKGSWLTHPAFVAFHSNGFWVGKFETGKTINSNDDIRNADIIQIKPNVENWYYINIANAFYSSYDYLRELDSHLIKNTEWGAVAYLQHSKYGSGNVSVRLNNNSNHITGYSAREEPTVGFYGIPKCTTSNISGCNSYDDDVYQNKDGTYGVSYYNPISVAASTTGNYYGIYDMSGNSIEIVMGVNSSPSNEVYVGKSENDTSGFNGLLIDGSKTNNGMVLPESKYYDLYSFRNSFEFSKRILGDALGELGPFGTNVYNSSYNVTTCSWHEDSAILLNGSTGPWILRGGDDIGGLSAGVFALSYHSGIRNTYGFRIVLTP